MFSSWPKRVKARVLKSTTDAPKLTSIPKTQREKVARIVIATKRYDFWLTRKNNKVKDKPIAESIAAIPKRHIANTTANALCVLNTWTSARRHNPNIIISPHKSVKNRWLSFTQTAVNPRKKSDNAVTQITWEKNQRSNCSDIFNREVIIVKRLRIFFL